MDNSGESFFEGFCRKLSGVFEEDNEFDPVEIKPVEIELDALFLAKDEHEAKLRPETSDR